MALPSSGTISLDNFNTDRFIPSGTEIDMAAAAAVYGITYSTSGSNGIGMDEFYGLFLSFVISPITMSEGTQTSNSSQQFTITATGIAQGTTIYWSVVNGTATTGDFSGATSGNVNVNSSGTCFFSLSGLADAQTEGTQSFNIKLRTGSQSGTVVLDQAMTITDTSVTINPTYSIDNNLGSNEGVTVTANVVTANVANGTTLYWTRYYVPGEPDNASDADFGSNSGSFTISSNAGSFSYTVLADTTTEGTEGYKIQIRTSSTSGTIVNTSGDQLILDTSTTSSGGTGGGSETWTRIVTQAYKTTSTLACNASTNSRLFYSKGTTSTATFLNATKVSTNSSGSALLVGTKYISNGSKVRQSVNGFLGTATNCIGQ
jgi:hypothetical protein